jgi:hypothetical protein
MREAWEREKLSLEARRAQIDGELERLRLKMEGFKQP